MSDQVRNYRSKLFKVLRLFFFTNLAFSLSLLVVAFYQRRRVSTLEDSVRFLARVNVSLQNSFEHSLHILTNDYFNVSSSFVSNLVSSSSSLLSSSAPFSPSAPSVKSFDSSQEKAELPPFDFHSYGECDGRPFIMLGRKTYFEGDTVLGFPIQFISPSVVVYREKYYKVGDIEKRSLGNEIFKK